jgi:hypothetical protein
MKFKALRPISFLSHWWEVVQSAVHQTLTLIILVRVQASQPTFKISDLRVFSCGLAIKGLDSRFSRYCANEVNTMSVNMAVRAPVNGEQKNVSFEAAKAQRLGGTLFIRRRKDGKIKWQSVGKDSAAARVAMIRKDRELSGNSPVLPNAATLADAIDIFVVQRTASQDAGAVRRWRWELERFAKVSGKLSLHEITHEDIQP